MNDVNVKTMNVNMNDNNELKIICRRCECLYPSRICCSPMITDTTIDIPNPVKMPIINNNCTQYIDCSIVVIVSGNDSAISVAQITCIITNIVNVANADIPIVLAVTDACTNALDVVIRLTTRWLCLNIALKFVGTGFD